MTVKLEKLQELPVEGPFVEVPKVGKCFLIGDSFNTSWVTEIINENTFKTRDAIYRWTIIDETL